MQADAGTGAGGGGVRAVGLLMVGCGHFHLMAVTEEGGLWSWGFGARGRLGRNGDEDRLMPVRVEVEELDAAKIVSAACGLVHLAAVTEDGVLHLWKRGSNLSSACRPGAQQPAGQARAYPAPLHTRARVGRCLPLPPLHALAFAMGTHSRLGPGAAGAGARACHGSCKGRSQMRATWMWWRIWCGKWWRGGGGRREGGGVGEVGKGRGRKLSVGDAGR